MSSNLIYTCNDRTPYTYLIGWRSSDKWYYGVRYGKGCCPTDLWVTYFTSSKIVAESRVKYGEPDIIVVRKVFNSIEGATSWEHSVLKRMNVIQSDKWLNAHNGTSPSYEAGLRGSVAKKPYSKNDHRRALSSTRMKNNIQLAMKNLNKMNSVDIKMKACETNKNRISSLSDEARKSMTAAMNSPEVVEKRILRAKEKLKNMSKEEFEGYKKKLSDASKKGKLASTYNASTDFDRNEKIRNQKLISNPGFSLITCPYCMKTGQQAAMKRWHFENCKKK